ncbi:MAG: DUF1122 family protein [Desulfurococcales archaeon]|nr:DUF1122 family protein [Desulfurococcales archaeon]MCE4605504.1 DUF1122 family protein [Desulfurococcales archaeon]
MHGCTILDRLEQDLRGTGLRLGDKRGGRIKGLILLNLHVSIGGLPYRAASLAVFCGRPPYYRPWIEVYNIEPVIGGERSSIPFIDSQMEALLLDSLAKALGPGDRLFIEYYRDPETLAQLEQGSPVIASRLGYELYKRGFTWFKVWYYPEGFNEGGQKIQAEKPLDGERRVSHLKEHLAELKSFLERHRMPTSPELGLALARARRLAREIEKILG